MTIASPATQTVATRQRPNRVVQHRVPIVFVPGIMGSRFEVTGEQVSWDPDSNVNMLRWASRGTDRKRNILDSGNAATVLIEPSSDFDRNHEDRVARGFGGVRWASYGTFLDFLEGLRFGSHHTPVYAYGYDWRQPVIQLGVQLAADILGTRVSYQGNRADPLEARYGGQGILTREEAEHCIILTHSMGGLVTRAALKASPELQGRTVAVLHGVQPATGAPTMYRRLITGMFRPVDGGGAVPDRVLRSILGTNGPDFATVASVIPGAMQLLPSNLYREDAAARSVAMVSWTRFEENHATFYGLTEDVYGAYRNRPHDSPPGFSLPGVTQEVRDALATRIDGLVRFHGFLERWKLADRTWAFFGDEVNSDSSVHFDLPPPPQQIRAEQRLLRSTRYTARNPQGATVDLDHETDIVRNGYAQRPPGRAPSAAHPWGFGPFGDGTVAAISGAALFGDDETAPVPESGAPDFDQAKQFRFPDLEHEPAYRDGAVQAFCRQWLQRVIAGLG